MPRWTRPIPEAPAEPGGGNGHHYSKGEKAVSIRVAEERLKRLVSQNERLLLETKARQGSLVELDVIKGQVLAANHIVKQTLLSIPDRLAGDLSVLTDPSTIRTTLRHAITKALNELAYEHHEL